MFSNQKNMPLVETGGNHAFNHAYPNELFGAILTKIAN